MFHSKQGGITLIELLTVIVIVAVLASVAIPSYRSYMIRTQRSDAKTALLNVRAAQEKFYLQNNRYGSLADLRIATTSDSGFYDVSLNPATPAQEYIAVATPRADRGQRDDSKCTTLTLSDVGVRGSSGPGGTEYCWR